MLDKLGLVRKQAKGAGSTGRSGALLAAAFKFWDRVCGFGSSAGVVFGEGRDLDREGTKAGARQGRCLAEREQLSGLLSSQG